MVRRYSYTPRRGGAPRRPATRRLAGDTSGDESYAALFIPVAIAVVLVGFGLAVSGGSAEFPARTPCTGTNCAPLAAGDAATPFESPTAQATPTAQAQPTAISNGPAPSIDGYAAAIVEAPCGGRVYGINEGLQMAPASLTKIMTAIVALERGDANELVDVEIDGGELSLSTDSTVMGLKPDDRLPLIDLVYGLMLRSGYDAAIEIAEHIAGDEPTFVGLMNERAADLGLAHTHFANAGGLDDPNLYTSAYDMARLGNVLLRNETLAQVVKTLDYQPAWDREALDNKNLFLTNYPGALGIKTGFTDLAAQTIVAAADKDGRRLIVSVLQSEDMYVDAALLLDWAFANTESAC
ncbi:MAG TPA: serine hydrolase [Dehalococcoidia bacterium]|nr:serine hydrolase [Dehalococcoidia bacterium]